MRTPSMLAVADASALGAYLGACTVLRGRNVAVPERAEVDVAMERYASGDDAAFALVYDTLAPRLYGYLLRQTREGRAPRTSCSRRSCRFIAHEPASSRVPR